MIIELARESFGQVALFGLFSKKFTLGAFHHSSQYMIVLLLANSLRLFGLVDVAD